MLEGSLGPAGSNRWRLWEASQALDGELNLKEATSNSSMDFIPGKAYWLYVSDDAIDLIQSLPDALVNPVHEPFEVPVRMPAGILSGILLLLRYLSVR